MFYGYESESQLRHYNPDIADHLISIAKKKEIVVCNRDKQCTGSINGKEFIYADGSTDFGQTITEFRAEIEGIVFKWSA